jgi:hypothetical protein
MDNPEKLAILSKGSGRRQTKQKHNAICVGHHYIKHESSYTKLEVKTKRDRYFWVSICFSVSVCPMNMLQFVSVHFM